MSQASERWDPTPENHAKSYGKKLDNSIHLGSKLPSLPEAQNLPSHSLQPPQNKNLASSSLRAGDTPMAPSSPPHARRPRIDRWLRGALSKLPELILHLRRAEKSEDVRGMAGLILFGFICGMNVNMSSFCCSVFS